MCGLHHLTMWTPSFEYPRKHIGSSQSYSSSWLFSLCICSSFLSSSLSFLIQMQDWVFGPKPARTPPSTRPPAAVSSAQATTSYPLEMASKFVAIIQLCGCQLLPLTIYPLLMPPKWDSYSKSFVETNCFSFIEL